MLLGTLDADLLQAKILPAAFDLLSCFRPDLAGPHQLLEGETLGLAGLLLALLSRSGGLLLGSSLQGFRGLSSIA